MPDRFDELMAQAEKFVDEALEPLVGVLPQDALDALREKFLFDLVVNPNGWAALRRTMEDAVVEHSGDPRAVDSEAKEGSA